MKNLLQLVLLYLLAAFSCFSEEELESKGILLQVTQCRGNQSSLFILLEDGTETHWKVEIPSEREPMWSEWFRGINISLPDRYKFIAEDWTRGIEIEIYKISKESLDFLSSVTHPERLEECSHILLNKVSGAVLFGSKKISVSLPPFPFQKEVDIRK